MGIVTDPHVINSMKTDGYLSNGRHDVMGFKSITLTQSFKLKPE